MNAEIDSLAQLGLLLDGDLYYDDLHRSIYATDASVYRMLPTAVAYPKNKSDLKKLVDFANNKKISLIPRAAGTSLGGQCVGEGIIVDISKHFTKILSLNVEEKTVTVQPGVIRDELNAFLEPHALFFGPNTSTSNRCMIGGMVGNNSSGSTSIQYGVTRDKVISVKCILSDGSEVEFKSITKKELESKISLDNLEGHIYKNIYQELSKKGNQENINKEFPGVEIHRRNTGYALDEILNCNLFTDSDEDLNISKLLCGSEGTLALITEVTLQLDTVPPPFGALVVTHYHTLQDSLCDVTRLMEHNLYSCEMMDKVILDCTKNNRTQQANRFFINGDPAAVLMSELRAESEEDLEKQVTTLLSTIENSQLSYAAPLLYGEDIAKAVDLRKAGLGLLGNMIGDRKAVACIEDTAVALADLKEYITEFSKIMENYGQEAVYYAHAGAGELHLRPILNLKKESDVILFRKITTDVAHLVKKYKGSFSGEHGDGIVRSEFIKLMIGDENYQLIRKIKSIFDPNNIFNRGKIVDPLPMDQNLRYTPERNEPEVRTIFDFSDSHGILRATEKCNGSGDCRKLSNAGGTMCPSYRATRNEKDTTRARANALREFLTHSTESNKFNHKELKEVFDLCLSCKACASECPSNVDIAILKAEFLYNYHSKNGFPLRSQLFAHSNLLNKLRTIVPGLSNKMLNNNFVKKNLGIALQRNIPNLQKQTLRKWCQYHLESVNQQAKGTKEVYLFCDEFTNYYDVKVGIDTIELLCGLGYHVHVIDHAESGRAHISKGFLKHAKKFADRNISIFKSLISQERPLIGIEPSAILSFRDEYLRLASDQAGAKHLSQHTFTIEEFLYNESIAKRVTSAQFHSTAKTIRIHGHCHQKALSKMMPTVHILNLPVNYNATLIPSGCCGMAGSFGYEAEHYDVSMQVGEDTLFPAIRKESSDVEISASGTSCRHQIFDGTNRTARHPVSVLRSALV